MRGEITDSITVIVSEETGYVSAALEGRLVRHMNAEGLTALLMQNLVESVEEQPKRRLLKGRHKNEKKIDK